MFVISFTTSNVENIFLKPAYSKQNHLFRHIAHSEKILLFIGQFSSNRDKILYMKLTLPCLDKTQTVPKLHKTSTVLLFIIDNSRQEHPTSFFLTLKSVKNGEETAKMKCIFFTELQA